MATALIVTFTSLVEDRVTAISSQTINFVTPQAAEKALNKIKEQTDRDAGGYVFVSGTIVGDVII